MQEMSNYSSSPFDAIRQMNDQGCEYWSARDLQELLGYVEWRNFEDSVTQAILACKNSGIDPESNFVNATKVTSKGRYGNYTVSDYHLTRYACYLVAMNGDPRKDEIASAQTYFAVKTREAEIGQSWQLSHYVNSDFALRLRLNKDLIPYDRWTVLEQIDKESQRNGLGLIKLIDKARPDISVGQMWSSYLRRIGKEVSCTLVENIVDPRTMKRVGVKSYSIDDLPLFLRFMHQEYKEHFNKHYLPERIEGQMNIKQLKPGTSQDRIKQIGDETNALLDSGKNIFRIGELLIEAKSILPPGPFNSWVKVTLRTSVNMARQYIKVFERFGHRSSSLGPITLSVLYELTSPGIPQDLIDSVLLGKYIPTTRELRAINKRRKEAKEPIMIHSENTNSNELTIQDLANQLALIQQSTIVKYVTPPELLDELAILREDIKKWHTSWEKSEEDKKVLESEISALHVTNEHISSEYNEVMKDRNAFVERYESLLKEHEKAMPIEVHERAIERVIQDRNAFAKKCEELSKYDNLSKRFIESYKQMARVEKEN